jgi:hypothetical protein
MLICCAASISAGATLFATQLGRAIAGSLVCLLIEEIIIF